MPPDIRLNAEPRPLGWGIHNLTHLKWSHNVNVNKLHNYTEAKGVHQEAHRNMEARHTHDRP